MLPFRERPACSSSRSSVHSTNAEASRAFYKGAVSFYATLSWTNDVDGNTVHSLGGNFGVRVAW